MTMYRVTIEGRTYEVEVEEVGQVEPNEGDQKDAYKQTVAKNTVQPKATSGTEVPAPLSGTIMSVKVKNGQKVSEGDVLLTLEALKLENEITAPVSGTIAQIVSESESVETDQIIAIIS